MGDFYVTSEARAGCELALIGASMDSSSSAIIGCRAAARCRGEGGTSPPADLKIEMKALRGWWRYFADAPNAITFR